MPESNSSKVPVHLDALKSTSTSQSTTTHVRFTSMLESVPSCQPNEQAEGGFGYAHSPESVTVQAVSDDTLSDAAQTIISRHGRDRGRYLRRPQTSPVYQMAVADDEETQTIKRQWRTMLGLRKHSDYESFTSSMDMSAHRPATSSGMLSGCRESLETSIHQEKQRILAHRVNNIRQVLANAEHTLVCVSQ
jgi:hypothetical protein